MILNTILLYRLDFIFFLLVSMLGAGMLFFYQRSRSLPVYLNAGLWVLLLFVCASVFFISENSAQDEKNKIIRMLEGFAPTYAQEIERMGHEKVRWETSPEDAGYLAMIEAQKRWLKANLAVNDIYTFARKPDGTAALVVDSETDYDRNGRYEGPREMRTNIGEEFPIQDEKVQKALNGEKVFDGNPYTDRWGTWVTMYYPIKNSQEYPEAVLGVDYAADSWIQAVFSRRLSVFLVGLAVVFLFLIYGFSAIISRVKDAYYRALIDNAQDIVTVLSPKGIAMYESPAIQDVLGYGPDELIGKNVFEYIHENDRARVLGIFQKLVSAQDLTLTVEFSFRHKNGSWIYLESRAKNFVQSPHVRGIVVNSRDITERKKALEMLENQKMQMIHQNKLVSLGEMAESVAHEINTPAGIILGRVQQLEAVAIKSIEKSAEFSACFEDIRKMVQRILKILRSLKNFAQDASQDMPVPAGLSAILEDALAICAERFKNHGIVLDTDFRSKARICVRPAEILQVLLNLLGNAFDALENQGGEKKVFLKTWDGEKHAVISISDNGPGVPLEIKDKIFEPFFTTKEIGKGAGLGLSICREIVLKHGGQIELSTQAPGACFVLKFPFYQPQSNRAA